MKKIAIVAALCAGLGVSSQAQAIGCFTGAAAGAVAGHVAGHHAIIGALGGCIVGHRLHKQQMMRRAEVGNHPVVTTPARTTAPAVTPPPATAQ